MSDVLTGLTEVTATVEDVVSEQIQLVLVAEAVVPPTVSDFSSQVRPGMDTLKIPRHGSFTVNTKTENVAVDSQTLTISTDNLDLNKHKVIQFLVEDIAELQAKVSFTQNWLETAGRNLAANMDQDLIDAIESGTSASTPDHRLAYAGSTLAKADVLTAREKLNDQNVPLSERFAIISPGSESALLAIAEFVRVDESGGSAALRNGEIGKLFGFTFFVSSQAETLKSLFYHRSAQAFARQLSPRVQQDMDLPNLAKRWSVDMLWGEKHLDSGKRAVMMGTAS